MRRRYLPRVPLRLGAMTTCFPLVPPWLPIETAPTDGRQFLCLWLDIDCTWNVDLMIREDDRFMSHGGNLYEETYVMGWMPRPPLPGPARLD